jgi:VWFA-related protein
LLSNGDPRSGAALTAAGLAGASVIAASTLLVAHALAVPAGSQVAGTAPPVLERIDGQSPAFRSGVELTVLNVTVTDAEGVFVPGLTARDFAVLEGREPQQVSFFATSPLPLDLGILLDTSASMSHLMGIVQKAAISFTSTLKPTDRVTVVSISDGMQVLHPLDEDLPGAQEAIRHTSAAGDTALHRALYVSLKELMRLRLGRTEGRRQALTVLTDGKDTASTLSFADVLDVAKEAGIPIYPIVPRTVFDVRRAAERSPGYLSSAEYEYGMKTLARETGGRAFFPLDVSELGGVYDAIVRELASQYVLGYVSTAPPHAGEYRQVLVRVPDHHGAQVRTRRGYVGVSTR